MFITDSQALRLRQAFQTPLFVYSWRRLREAAVRARAVRAPFGCTVRYAMKANPTRGILNAFRSLGIRIDASSSFEARRAVLAGFAPSEILLTSQELKLNQFEGLLLQGMEINASSIRQLELLLLLKQSSRLFDGIQLGLRVNPGVGSGSNAKTTVGGRYAGFGIWHEQVGQAAKLCRQAGVPIVRLHFHVGSGSEASAVTDATGRVLSSVYHWLPEVTTLNVGGGFGVNRLHDSGSADLNPVLQGVFDHLTAFAALNGRRLRLEIEPGAYLVANAGVLLATAIDVKQTDKVNFIVLDSGMTEIMRPSLYGARHPIRATRLVKSMPSPKCNYRIIGHCCESGDVLTVRESETFAPSEIRLPLVVPNDIIQVGGVGAYCASMCAKNYNSFPDAAEVMLYDNGRAKLIKQRQSLEQYIENES